ncbi:MAG: hypothetical protein WBC60_00035 [Cognaticolwellia sp.]
MRLIVLLLIFFITSCSLFEPKDIESEDLVGAWELLYDGKGDYWFSHVGFNTAGEKCTISYSFDSNKELSVSYYLSSYKVEKNELIVKVVSSSSPFINVDEVIKDNLLSYAKDKFQMQMFFPIVSTAVDHFTKLEGVDADSICKVVKNNS